MTASRIPFVGLSNANLTVDAVYEGGRAGNSGDDPINVLIPGVGNQGGFRFSGAIENPKIVVLYTSLLEAEWPDAIDESTGTFTYFGDNKSPGHELHDTPRGGNKILKQAFANAHAGPEGRLKVPPFLIFSKTGRSRDVTFRGLAVPGAANLKATDDLIAVWKSVKAQRFQNYRAVFTILDVGSVPRNWLIDLRRGDLLSANCPTSFRQWTEEGLYHALKAAPSIAIRSKAQQLPSEGLHQSIISKIREYFADDPYLFERCAAKLAEMMDPNIIDVVVTRASRDGGRDAVGKYRIGPHGSDITVDFALEAKCYGEENSVGVREVSRLISRLRHRQFGILVTTSYVHSQAYQEIVEDGHPIIVLAAADIARMLVHKGFGTTHELLSWLRAEFPSD